MKTFEFTDEQRHELIEIFVHGTIQELLSRIEQIVSERITPEQDTIKPYHEHGNSVASDRTESGQSADGGIAIMEILQPIHRHPFDAESGREMEIWYTHKDVWNAMTTYASQVCADKEQEIDRINESLTVMVNRNAELEKELEYAKIR